MIREIRVNNAWEREMQPDGSFVTTIDAYTGCQLQCPYCFQMSKEHWAENIFVKTNITEVLKPEIQSLEKHGTELFIGSLSDPYMDLEKEYKLTKAILTVLKDVSFQVYLTTKAVNGLIVRDLEIFKSFKIRPVIMLGLSDMKHAGDGSSHPNIEIANRFYEEGIPVRVFITPILPYIMNLDAMIGAIRPEINIYLDKLRVLKKADQQKKTLARIQSDYPMYAEDYYKILIEGNTDYYRNIILKYKNNKQVIFMTELWNENE